MKHTVYLKIEIDDSLCKSYDIPEHKITEALVSGIQHHWDEVAGNCVPDAVEVSAVEVFKEAIKGEVVLVAEDHGYQLQEAQISMVADVVCEKHSNTWATMNEGILDEIVKIIQPTDIAV